MLLALTHASIPKAATSAASTISGNGLLLALSHPSAPFVLTSVSTNPGRPLGLLLLFTKAA